MKFVASVSFAALALAGCAVDSSGTPVAAVPRKRRCTPQPAPMRLPHPLTPEGARQFIADVEKDLFDLSVIGGRAQWVNATYINDDTDALAAYFGTIGTEKGVKYAKQSARIRKGPGPRSRHRPQAQHPSRRAGSGRSDDSGRRRRAQRDHDPPAVDLRQGARDA